jgi:hypothetical protein
MTKVLRLTVKRKFCDAQLTKARNRRISRCRTLHRVSAASEHELLTRTRAQQAIGDSVGATVAGLISSADAISSAMDRIGIGAWRFVRYVRRHTTRASWSHARPRCSAPPSASNSSVRSFAPAFLHALAVRRSAVRFARGDQFPGGLHPKSMPMPGAHKKAG